MPWSNIIKGVLGEKILRSGNKYNMSTIVSSILLSGLGFGRRKTIGRRVICRKVARTRFLGELDDALKNVVVGSEILLPKGYYVIQVRGREVNKYPLIFSADPGLSPWKNQCNSEKLIICQENARFEAK